MFSIFRVNLFVSILMHLVSLLVLILKRIYWRSQELYVKPKTNVHFTYFTNCYVEHLLNKRVSRLFQYLIYNRTLIKHQSEPEP